MTDAEQIAQLQAELAVARAEMQAFAATVSHDLRAPLRHITSFVQLLQNEAGPLLQGESAEFLGHITSASQQLGGMLDALRLIRRGIPAGAALDMGITNKAFDSYEQSLIRDVIAARIPAKLDAAKLFG